MKKVLLYVSIGLLLLAIPATIFFLGQQRDLRAKAAPATTISLTPATQTVKVGDSVKLNVTINPGSNEVVSARIHVTYDPVKLTAISITNGTNAPKILNSGVVASGSANITVAAASNAQPITAPGSIAVITLTANTATTAIAPATVEFATDTFVGALSEPDTNVLVGSVGAKITISGTATSTPTLVLTTPSGTPSATLTPNVTPTIPASQSGVASSSAITILPIPEDSGTVSAMPVVRVKGPPGSTVTVVFHSEPQTCIAVIGPDGYGTCSPTDPLNAGPHNITASIQTASGSTQIATESIIVGSETGGSVMPVSGNVETTLLVIGLGLCLMVTGALIPIFVH